MRDEKSRGGRMGRRFEAWQTPQVLIPEAMEAADRLMEIAMGEKPGPYAEDDITTVVSLVYALDEKGWLASAVGSIGGRKGGLARAAKLSPERRSEIARDAAAARWAKQEGPDHA